MAEYTQNYNLKKPAEEDFYNVKDFNDNADIIDQALKAHDGALDAHMSDGTQHAKTVRFVIGTSTSGWTEKDCDYLCDGTDDQVEINNAITALPDGGGEVVILDGTYNITAKIDVNKDNVSIRGNGNATVLKRMWNSSSPEGVITLTSVEGCRVENLQIDGNKVTYTANDNSGIRLYLSNNNTIISNTCNNNDSGIHVRESSNNTITGNTCYNNENSGIHPSSSNNNTITGNTCNNNENGIRLYISNNNTITGNTCNNNENSGIYLSSSNNNTITGNTCYNNNNYGILLYISSNNTVTGNTCIRGIGTPEDYATNQRTIFLSGTDNNYNLISSNNCMGKAVEINNGTGNTVFNNKWDASDDVRSADTENYYVSPFTVPATDGTGEINAATITSVELYSLYDALVATYPDYITREFLGKDASDTLPIYKYIFTPKNYTKTIIVGAGIHGERNNGDPKDNPIALYYAMKTICENWQNDRKLADLRWDCQIVVIPIENPWGFDNEYRYNANGVDLNRNFDWRWEDYVSGEPYSMDYKGTAPFSEPESQYIRDTLMAHPEAVAYIPFHAWDDITEFKYAYRASSFSLLNDIAENLISYLCAKYNVGKDFLTASDALPTAANYAQKMLNIPSATPEYVVFEQGVPHRTSELNTRMVEWYLNWIYLCKLNRIKKTEGTWTPYIFGNEVAGKHNYDTNATTGFYKIMGDIVFLNGYIVLNGKDNNMAGNVRIGGLPFCSRNVRFMNHGFQLMSVENLSYGTANAIHLTLRENENSLEMFKINNNAERTFVQPGDIGNNFRMAFSGWYRIR